MINHGTTVTGRWLKSLGVKPDLQNQDDLLYYLRSHSHFVAIKIWTQIKETPKGFKSCLLYTSHLLRCNVYNQIVYYGVAYLPLTNCTHRVQCFYSYLKKLL